MRSLLNVLLVLLTFNCSAQTTPLNNFYKTGASWCEFYTESASQGQYYENFYKFQIHKDTVINGTTYKLLVYDQSYIYHISGFSKSRTDICVNKRIAALRVDTQKVYIMLLDKLPLPHDTSLTAGTEQLLYDFNIDKDSVFAWKTQNKKVRKTDSVQLSSGAYVKRYFFLDSTSGGQTYQDYWIYGLGANKSFFDPIITKYTYTPSQTGPLIYSPILVNCYENGSIGYKYFDKAVGCLQPTGISKSIPKEEGIKVFPNPVSGDAFHISSDRVIQQMIITDAYGRTVYRDNKTYHAGTHAVKAPSACGVYIISIMLNDGTVIKEKLIKAE